MPGKRLIWRACWTPSPEISKSPGLLAVSTRFPCPKTWLARLSDGPLFYEQAIVSNLNGVAKLILVEPTAASERKGGGLRPVRPGGADKSKRTAAKHAIAPIQEDKLNVYVQRNISLKFQFLERTQMIEICEVTAEQLALSRRLDEVARSLLAYWGRKNLDAAEVAERWPDRAFALRNAIVDRSESILFSVILSPKQAEKFKCAYWTIRGLKSLLDPELALRLRIDKEQRVMIEDALNNSVNRTRAMTSELQPFLFVISGGEKFQQALQAQALIDQTTFAAEQAVWDILTPSQISKLHKLLGEKALKSEAPPRQKVKKPKPEAPRQNVPARPPRPS